jgi:hypothetical protein
MSMNWKGALGAGAVIGASVLAACSDAATGPASPSAVVPKAIFAVGDLTNATAVPTELKVCKTADSDVGGTFNVTFNPAIAPGPTGGNGGTGNPTVATPVSVAPGQCKVVAIDMGDANEEMGDFFQVVEVNAPNVTETLVSCIINGGASIPCNNNYFINTAHGVTLTYRNIADAPPPPQVCTYTKGWYQNKNGRETIMAGVDGLTIAQQYLVFSTQPNPKATITWDGGNNSLNLFQQFLAALNNLENNEDAGPDAVDAAIDLVQDNTSFNGSHITVNLTAAQVSAAINTLSSFNEGKFNGYPHCD